MTLFRKFLTHPAIPFSPPARLGMALLVLMLGFALLGASDCDTPAANASATPVPSQSKTNHEHQEAYATATAQAQGR